MMVRATPWSWWWLVRPWRLKRQWDDTQARLVALDERRADLEDSLYAAQES
jgi:hypothetical protein